jgi:hypothetical protein
VKYSIFLFLQVDSVSLALTHSVEAVALSPVFLGERLHCSLPAEAEVEEEAVILQAATAVLVAD